MKQKLFENRGSSTPFIFQPLVSGTHGAMRQACGNTKLVSPAP
jgi:hypothetical protein